MANLQVSKSLNPDGVTRIALTGAIDETSDLNGLFREVKSDAVINFARVERMNSIGIQRWIPLVRQFTAERKLSVEALSYSVVLQANAVANLFPGATIASCMAPFFCPKCGADRTVEIRAQDVAPDAPPKRACPKCSTDMEFDELDGYFSFFFRVPHNR